MFHWCYFILLQLILKCFFLDFVIKCELLIPFAAIITVIFVSPCSLQDVIHAIRDTAFVTSEYPVLLSFENHCRLLLTFHIHSIVSPEYACMSDLYTIHCVQKKRGEFGSHS